MRGKAIFLQLAFEYVGSVFLNADTGEEIIDVISLRHTITVDATVFTSSVGIERAVHMEPAVRYNEFGKK